jgi:DNA-directed RNA polymerase subunit E'/Rpb7
MFYIVKLSDRVTVRAEQVGPDIMAHVKNELVSEYQGKILGSIGGYIVKILKISDQIGLGRLNMSGNISYEVIYYAVIFIPKNRQILDIVLTEIDATSMKGVPYLIEPGNTKITCIINNDLAKPKGKEPEKEKEKGSVVPMYIMNSKIEYSDINIIGYISA